MSRRKLAVFSKKKKLNEQNFKRPQAWSQLRVRYIYLIWGFSQGWAMQQPFKLCDDRARTGLVTNNWGHIQLTMVATDITV